MVHVGTGVSSSGLPSAAGSGVGGGLPHTPQRSLVSAEEAAAAAAAAAAVEPCCCCCCGGGGGLGPSLQTVHCRWSREAALVSFASSIARSLAQVEHLPHVAHIHWWPSGTLSSGGVRHPMWKARSHTAHLTRDALSCRLPHTLHLLQSGHLQGNMVTSSHTNGGSQHLAWIVVLHPPQMSMSSMLRNRSRQLSRRHTMGTVSGGASGRASNPRQYLQKPVPLWLPCSSHKKHVGTTDATTLALSSRYPFLSLFNHRLIAIA
mmetsp:Transcript_13969/g.33246  ORF Transcript_13969/g.33246 Transcript_13969/m.33246 type:complete len:262 (+) Transcript_13969:1010-1795(+)